MNKANINKLDKVFSKFIRLRDSKKFEHKAFICISCGKVKPYEQADCGHFVSRRYLATRWNEQNCNAQCRHCNRFLEGNKYGYSKGIDKKYGKGTADKLEALKHQKTKITDIEAKYMIKEYQMKIKELKK